MNRSCNLVLAFALAAAFAGAAHAAPHQVIDQRCRVNQINQCTRTNYPNISMTGPFLSPIEQRANAAEKCGYVADLACVVTVDVPSLAEIKAANEESNRLQREQWAAWLRTLEETGVVAPRTAPSPPPPTRR